MIKALTSAAARALDAATIEREPVASIDLMERAAAGLCAALREEFGPGASFLVLAGPGNNGGDAVALYRLLAAAGHRADLWLVWPDGAQPTPNCRGNLARLDTLRLPYRRAGADARVPAPPAHWVVVDGLLGSGLSRPLEGVYRAAAERAIAWPNPVAAIDIPSGLFADAPNAPADAVLRADITLSIQLPKPAFFMPECAAAVGRWRLVDIGLHAETLAQAPCETFVTQLADIRAMWRPRRRFAHKGDFGHVLVAAGGEGKYGAMLLCARGCLRAGAGRVTALTDGRGQLALNLASPEAMSLAAGPQPPDLAPYNAVCFGPGAGTGCQAAALLDYILVNHRGGLVVDADGLNLLASGRVDIGKLPAGAVLTPHVGEMDRLCGRSANGYERLAKARGLARRHRCVVVLKGAYTAVVDADGVAYHNPTGNPGMATAGSGDTLAGIVAALLACGYPPADAARAGVWLHGRAGDIALRRQSPESLVAGDIAEALGEAFRELAADIAPGPGSTPGAEPWPAPRQPAAAPARGK